MFEITKLLIEHVHLWEVTILLCVIWLWLNPEYLKMIQSIKVGDLEIKLKELEKEFNERKEEIQDLESEIENNRRLFGNLLDGFEANSSLEKLAKTRELLKDNARVLTDIDELAKLLESDATPEELYAAAVTIREKRPIKLFDRLIDCLNRLAEDDNLQGIRLNTVWTLASAAHLILVSAIRSRSLEINEASLLKAKTVLLRLEINPRVLKDRPDQPHKGVRGPIKNALSWIEKGLTAPIKK